MELPLPNDTERLEIKIRKGMSVRPKSERGIAPLQTKKEAGKGVEVGGLATAIQA
jgi:hypothetical protein